MASKLLETGWFGPYDQMTLMKGPAYPAFIAANFLVGLPLLLTTQLVFVGACVALAGTLSLYPLPRAAALLSYAATLFNPITFIPEAFTSLRTEIYLALTIAVAAGWLALPMAAMRWRLLSITGLGVVTGLAFAAFWMTREEGIWLVPALAIFAGAFGLLYWRRGDRATLVRYAIGIGAMFAMFGLVDLAVSARNWTRYSFFGTTDILATGYTGAYQSLVRVRPVEWKHHLPVPREVRERIYAVSPAFREIRAGLEGSGFKQEACAYEILKHACGDLGAGWFLFALRDAVAAAGHYTSGDRAEAFYKRLAAEVNAACEAGRLNCSSPGFGFVPPLSWTIVGMTFDSLKHVITRVMFMSDLPLGPQPGSGSELFPYVAGLTHNRLAPTPNTKETPYSSIEGSMMRSTGWVYHRDPAVNVRVDPNPDQLSTRLSTSIIKRYGRPDIAPAFKDKDPRTATAGFDIRYRCEDPCYFVLRAASGAETRVQVPRKPSDAGADSNGFIVRYDFWGMGDEIGQQVRVPPPQILLQRFDNMKLSWRARASAAYRAAMPFALLAALGMLGWVVWRCFVDRTVCAVEPWLMLGFAVTALATRVAIIALLDAVLSAPNGTSYDYISPIFTLYALALALCISLPFAQRHDIDHLRPVVDG